MQIKIQYHADIDKICAQEKGDWLDLRASETVEFRAGQHKLIPLGVSMLLPPEHEAHVVPRSSTFKHWGLLQTNSPGIIDESFCGPDDIWFFSAYATRDTVVKKNERICQFRLFKKMQLPEIVAIENLNNPNRGGYGSTGKI